MLLSTCYIYLLFAIPNNFRIGVGLLTGFWRRCHAYISSVYYFSNKHENPIKIEFRQKLNLKKLWYACSQLLHQFSFQIVCALIGSLGALFNGVLVINLVIGLFAVVAIESSSQKLGRTYAVLLFFAVVLDVAWFILFSHAIWYVFGSHHLSVQLPQFFHLVQCESGTQKGMVIFSIIVCLID